MQYDNLPKALQENAKFCLWMYEEREGQTKPSKVPYQTSGRRGQSNNEKTFTDYTAALEVVNRYDGLGIGIFKGFSAIDIDHCINEDGTLSDLSKAIVDLFAGCYIEKSPSGKGFRILFKASGFKYNTNKYYINNINIGVEVYVFGATNKFVTVTGNVFRDGDIIEAADKLEILLDYFMLRQVKNKSKSEKPAISYLSDEEVFSRAEAAKSSEEFIKLWNGEIPEGKSHSEADLALCAHLAFWCSKDTTQMDRLFRQSGLYREKWDRVQSGTTYEQITLEKAFDGMSETYSPIGRLSKIEMVFVNQKAILKKYAEDNSFRNIRFYVDDGVSGTTFDRTDFNRMIADVEAGMVGTIIKDMSRLGRDYLKVGYFTEIMFPEAGVRFIAINNSIDSANQQDSDFTPFLNIINEWYAKDTSKKIRAVFKSNGESGKPLCTNPHYGYFKDPEDKFRWIIDEEAAEVVREIFRLCMAGFGPSQIARQLKERCVNVPTVHLRSKGINTPARPPENPYGWQARTVADILARMEYLGHLVNLKSFKKSYKSKTKVQNNPEDWLIFENNHESIIDEGTWEIVQKIRDGERRPSRMSEMGMLSGMMFCADCGAKLYQVRANGWTHDKEHFVCATYRKVKGGCSSHQIRNVVVEQLITEDLRKVLAFAKEREEEFIKTERTTRRRNAPKRSGRFKRNTISLRQGLRPLTRLFKNSTKTRCLAAYQMSVSIECLPIMKPSRMV